MEKRHGRSAEEHQRRNHEHEQNVLDHVRGKGDLVEGGKGRADRKPEAEHPSQKRG